MSIISCHWLRQAMRAMLLFGLCIPAIEESAAEAQDTAKATPEPKTTIAHSDASTAAQDAKPTSLPLHEGVPVNQWYMRTTDADGSKAMHYIAECGMESKPGNTVIVLHGAWHSCLAPIESS